MSSSHTVRHRLPVVAELLANPWLIQGVGVATIVGLIVVARANAFLALIAAARVEPS